ncbi:sugar phosphate isomerase/epimerase family protein [Blastopirellula retiformator]|uniref:L-ribulose-5-phosphate 3-epimerase UlaE n=1 Tax=Blastopirellula retiformator TaxID=2527970 RepID=A0A5C5V0T6_9BACT|nr:sugar phosphate isomerase/epimerase family protein [Blastopirellula retiformator]TWT32001.1 L-ribulose-5-phosphate 3-epimerase UlaE [Blastopirellula retiformator]
MRIGYNTNGFAHHDPLDAVDVLADLGYESVAFTVDHGTLTPFGNTYMADRQADHLAALLAEKKMACVIESGARFLLDPKRKHEPTLVSPDRHGRQRRFEFIRHCIDEAVKLKADCVSLWSGKLLDDASPKAAMDRLVEALQPVIEYAEQQQMPLGFEPEPGMFIDTMDRFAELCERIDSPLFQLTLDIGHLQCQAELPLGAVIREWGSRIVNVHIEDMKRGVHEHLPFGEGEIDFSEVISALRDANYKLGLHVELSRHSHEAPTMAALAMEFLRPLVHPK